MAVLRTWGEESLITFPGWEDDNDNNDWCPNGDFFGVRISMASESVSHGLGTELLHEHPLTNQKGLSLDFNLTTPLFATNAPFGLSARTLCSLNFKSLDQCIEFLAVHEFGHVLGLSHEHNRPDEGIHLGCGTDNLPEENVYGNTFFTRFDPNSIMNYCRQAYYGDSSLSKTDKIAIKAYYGNIPTYNVNTNILNVPRLRVRGTSYYYQVAFHYNVNTGLLSLTEVNYTSSPISSSVEVIYDMGNIDIPLFKVEANNFNNVVDEVLFLMKMNLQPSGSQYSINSLIEHPDVFPSSSLFGQSAGILNQDQSQRLPTESNQ